MKHFLLIMILVAIANSVCSGNEAKEKMPYTFEVAFEQDYKIKQAVNNVVKLKAKPFTIVVNFKGKLPKGKEYVIAVRADQSGHYCKNWYSVKKGQRRRLPGTGMAEDSSNPAKELRVFRDTDGAFHFWFLNAERNEHRFHSCKPTQMGFECRREIRTLYFYEGFRSWLEKPMAENTEALNLVFVDNLEETETEVCRTLYFFKPL